MIRDSIGVISSQVELEIRLMQKINIQIHKTMKPLKNTSLIVAGILTCLASSVPAVSITIVDDLDWQFLATYHAEFPAQLGGLGGGGIAIDATYWSGYVGFAMQRGPFPDVLLFYPYMEMSHSSAGSGLGSSRRVDTRVYFNPDSIVYRNFAGGDYVINPGGHYDHYELSGTFQFDLTSGLASVDGTIRLFRYGLPNTPDEQNSAYLMGLALGALLITAKCVPTFTATRADGEKR